jgi:hypothetical protein
MIGARQRRAHVVPRTRRDGDIGRQGRRARPDPELARSAGPRTGVLGDVQGRVACSRRGAAGCARLQRRPWTDPPAAGSWSIRRLAIFAVVRRDHDPPRRFRQRSPRWLRSEEQLVQSGTRAADGRPDRRTCRLPRGNRDAGDRPPRTRPAARACAEEAPRFPSDPGEPSFALSVKASLAARGASRPWRRAHCGWRAIRRAGGPPRAIVDCAARNPRCATWSRLPGQDAAALSTEARRSRARIRGLDLGQVDQYPAAVRGWIMPTCGSRSRRQVDLS